MHPVRLRIVHAMSGGTTLTTAELCGRLTDVSKATVYRQVGRLVDGGVLDLAGERRVRGAVERSYRLRRDRPDILEAVPGPPDPQATDVREAFGVAVSTLLAEFDSYLSSADLAPETDLVGFGQHAIWLSPVERAELVSALRAVIAPRLANAAESGRRRHLLSPILFPTG